jgi:hypothetical protein
MPIMSSEIMEGIESLIPEEVREVPFAGTYPRRINVKRQSTVPREMRDILMMRQGQGSPASCALFYSLAEESIILKDMPEFEECPHFNLVRMDPQGRIVLPAEIFAPLSWVQYVGMGDQIAVYPINRPKA